jgi:hypothetical protein
MRRRLLVLAVLLVFAGWVRGDEPPSRLFPFVLPWDDASDGVTHLSAWLPKPAGQLGTVHAGKDGHLYTGDQRVRFFGVNLCFSGCFPRHADADKVAARMAKFGINAVRFHHMDMQTFPGGIRARKAKGTGELDPEALDRLGYLVARLKEHGIYTNLNLLVSRPFNGADGLPAEIEQIDWKDRAVTGFFYEPALRVQKDYARSLLTYRNPHTKLKFAEDPAVAFVEINNENGLVHAWLGRQVDRLPDVFRKDLLRKWNDWLRRRHGTTAKLRAAWGVKEVKPGKELIANAGFAKGLEPWVLERHENAEGSAAASDDVPPPVRSASSSARSARITVTRTSPMAWHVQFNQRGINLQSGRTHTLTFWAKANKPLQLSAGVGQAHEPWKELGLLADVRLTNEWKPFRFVFLPSASDHDARVNFSNLAAQTATVWLAGVSLRPGGVIGLDPAERLEDGSVHVFERSRFSERTAEAQRDWLRFLWETEDAYWQAMQCYLKEELKVRGVVVGTIVGCSTPNLMARLDAVDTHAYWLHPHFPHRPWDPDDWTVQNRTMVNEAGGTLPGLALRRVLGKPHCVTEYNHPAPNTYGSEGLLLLAAYGALQDWDAIYAFTYSQRTNWDAGRIDGFFDIDQHPTRMATLPAAVAMFVRGDVKPAEKQVIAALDREREPDLLRRAGPWELIHAGTVGVPRETALVHRVAMATDGTKAEKAEFDRPAGPRYTSDTGELVWDLSTTGRGVVSVNTPKSKAVIGYGRGKRFELGKVVIEPGETAQDGWCTVTLTATEGDLSGGPARLLVTATGTAENTGMKWKSPAHDSVGRNWGKAPSLVEGVPARITLPVAGSRVRAWVLDERGQRRADLPVQTGGGRAALEIGPRHRTLWYEVWVE